MTATEIKNKLAAARTRLILDKPFLGALVLRLPMHAADPQWCPTTATDAKAFYYNAEYIEALKPEQVQFVLAHEALHCALSHFARRQHRVKLRWDMACDHAINPLLLHEGLSPPPGVWVDTGFLGMTAEEIYPSIDENNSDEPMDKHVYDDDQEQDNNHPPPQPPDKPDEQNNSGDSGEPQDPSKYPESGSETETDENQGGAPQPPPLSRNERENLDTQWQQRLAGAAQQALQAGKLGGETARLVDHLLQPRLPWRNLLAHYMTANARDDYTYMRPSRREGNAIFPSLCSVQLEVAVALDVSGSVSDKEIAQCLAEVDSIKGQMRARVILLPCDAALAPEAPWIYEPWDEIKLPKQMCGGGGTDFTPVFDWLAQQDRAPDLLLYFTDAEGCFPQQAPAYPVIWLVKGRGKVPWGQRIQLN